MKSFSYKCIQYH